MVRFIGDVHGKFQPYYKIIAECEGSIQLGDMGVGFRSWPHGEYMANPSFDKMFAGGHRFIRGNHDNPHACVLQRQWIPDGTYIPPTPANSNWLIPPPKYGIMFIGGAVSIDAVYRVENYSWWRDEELSTPHLTALVDKYLDLEPRIMVTHECPESIAEIMMVLTGRRKLDFPSRTRQAFQSMFEKHQPELWIFAHWHMSFDKVIEGTRFICLNELEYKDIDTEGAYL